MELICIDGPIPGEVIATVTHLGQVRQVPVQLKPHRAGGWQARHSRGAWGLRCHEARTAVLLEAAESFDMRQVELAAD